jgi:hypothetical protein
LDQRVAEAERARKRTASRAIDTINAASRMRRQRAIPKPRAEDSISRSTKAVENRKGVNACKAERGVDEIRSQAAARQRASRKAISLVAAERAAAWAIPSITYGGMLAQKCTWGSCANYIVQSTTRSMTGLSRATSTPTVAMKRNQKQCCLCCLPLCTCRGR